MSNSGYNIPEGMLPRYIVRRDITWGQTRLHMEDMMINVWFNSAFPNGFPYEEIPPVRRDNIMIEHFWLLDDLAQLIEMGIPNQITSLN